MIKTSRPWRWVAKRARSPFAFPSPDLFVAAALLREECWARGATQKQANSVAHAFTVLAFPYGAWGRAMGLAVVLDLLDEYPVTEGGR